MPLTTLDYISINTLNNIDEIIEYNPYSTLIKIEKIETNSPSESTKIVFGYEETNKEEDIISKGLIIYEPDRRFLKQIGIYTEDDLPIIGLFKHHLKLKKGDVIIQIITDFIDGQEKDIEREFHVIDIKSAGDKRTGRKYYHLAPGRGLINK